MERAEFLSRTWNRPVQHLHHPYNVRNCSEHVLCSLEQTCLFSGRCLFHHSIFEKTAVFDVRLPSNAAVVPLFVLFPNSCLSLPLWISLLSMYKNTGFIITSHLIKMISVLYYNLLTIHPHHCLLSLLPYYYVSNSFPYHI